MPNHDVRAVANEFLKLAREQDIFLSNMQLQKLPYFAYGYSLVLGKKKPLISEKPQAWPYGPVFPSLYDALKRYGSGGVLNLIRENDGNPWALDRGDVLKEDFSAEEKAIIKGVWEGYGHMSAFELSRLTHKPNTPWSQTREKLGQSDISDDCIKSSFEKLLKN